MTEQPIEVLLEELRSGDLESRRRAEQTLVNRGEEAIGPLIAFLAGETQPDVCWYAARALARIGPPAVDPLLAALREHPEESLRRYYAAALAEMEEPAIEKIIGLFEEKDPILRRFGMMILCRIGEPAMERLEELTGEDTLRGRCAEYTLRRIGLGSPEG